MLIKCGTQANSDFTETRGDQGWATFVQNHAKTIVACDFFVSVTATFRLLYVFVALEIGTHPILHLNLTAHPTAEWSIQLGGAVAILGRK
jgi:hypothetical protein